MDEYQCVNYLKNIINHTFVCDNIAALIIQDYRQLRVKYLPKPELAVIMFI